MTKRLVRATPVEPIGQPTTEWALDDRARAAYVAERMPRWKVLYETTQNPMFAWRAYELAREAGIKIPTWVLEYFDLAAQNLGWFESTLRKRKAQKKTISGVIAPGVTAALGFVPAGVEQTFIENVWPDAPEARVRAKSGAFNAFARVVSGPPEYQHANVVWILHRQMGKLGFPFCLPGTRRCYTRAPVAAGFLIADHPAPCIPEP